MTLADPQPRAADRRTDRSSQRWREPPDRWDRRSSRWHAYARAYDPDSGRADENGSNDATSSVGSIPPCGEGSGAGVGRSSSRRCQTAPNLSSPNRWATVCEDLTSALRNWPVREIERGVRLSEPQRVAFYELVTASLRAANTLAGACPAETALTPTGRMASLRARLAAVRAATAAIRPALAGFYEALDQEQKVRFAGMS